MPDGAEPLDTVERVVVDAIKHAIKYAHALMNTRVQLQLLDWWTIKSALY